MRTYLEHGKTKKSKLSTLAFVLILSALIVSGCGPITAQSEVIRGSGNVVTQEETFSGFDKVDASQAFEVDISQGDTFSVVIRIDDNLVQYLQVVKQGNTLKIGLRPGRRYNIRNATMEAEVTMPELTGLDLSGASPGRPGRWGRSVGTVWATDSLGVRISGSGSVNYYGNPRTTFSSSGSGKINSLGNL